MNTSRAHLSRPFRVLATGLAIAVISASAAQAGEKFIPGVTDFPSRPAIATAGQFIPGVSDFPSRPASRDADWIAPAPRSWSPSVTNSGGFNWDDAGIGAGIASALILSLGLAGAVARNRRRLAQAS